MRVCVVHSNAWRCPVKPSENNTENKQHKSTLQGDNFYRWIKPLVQAWINQSRRAKMSKISMPSPPPPPMSQFHALCFPAHSLTHCNDTTFWLLHTHTASFCFASLTSICFVCPPLIRPLTATTCTFHLNRWYILLLHRKYFPICFLFVRHASFLPSCPPLVAHFALLFISA